MPKEISDLGLISQKIGQSEDDDYDDEIKTIIENIEQLFDKNIIILSESQDAIFLKSLNKKYEAVNKSPIPISMYVWWAYIRPSKYEDILDVNIVSRLAQQIDAAHRGRGVDFYTECKLQIQLALSEATRYLTGDQSSIDSRSKEIENLLAGFQANSSQMLDDANQKIESFQKKYDDLKEKTREIQCSHEIKKDKFEEFYCNTKKDWENLKYTYDKELSLQAPAKYWKTQEKVYKGQKKCALLLGILFAITSFLVLIFISMFELTNTIQNTPLYKLFPFAIATTFSLWISYIVVKIFLSYQHLENQARQKRTLNPSPNFSGRSLTTIFYGFQS